jgi:hypothetical protein
MNGKRKLRTQSADWGIQNAFWEIIAQTEALEVKLFSTKNGCLESETTVLITKFYKTSI